MEQIITIRPHKNIQFWQQIEDNSIVCTEIHLKHNSDSDFGEYIIPYDLVRRQQMPDLVDNIVNHIELYGTADAIDFYKELMI